MTSVPNLDFTSLVPNGSNSSEETCTNDTLHDLQGAVYCIIFILGFPGNLVALWAFFSVKSKANSTRVFLLNLVFADLLLVASLPLRIFYHIHDNDWNMPPLLCSVVSYLFYTNMYISIVLLGLISVDRYVKINRSRGTLRRMLTPKSTRIISAVVWIGVSVITFSVYSTRPLIPNHRCFQYLHLKGNEWKGYINITALVFFWIVFTALMVSYGKITQMLLKRSRTKPQFPNAHRYVQSAKKSFFILFVFTFCFVPYHLIRIFYIQTQITDSSCYLQNIADQANEVALLFSACNSCLDPIMYFLLSSSVRKEMLRMANSMVRKSAASKFNGSSSTDDGNNRKVQANGENVRVRDSPNSVPLSNVALPE